MKNKAIKILILTFTAAMAVGSIFIFWKYRINKPPLPTEREQFVEDMELSLQEISDKNSLGDIRLVFNTLLDKYKLYSDEEYVNIADYDAAKVQAVDAVVPVFDDLCKNYYSKSVWKKADLKEQRDFITQLNKLTLSEGTRLLNERTNHQTSLNEIKQVLDNYDNAWILLRKTNYVNIATAKNRIQESKKYKEAPYLQNRSDLSQKLKDYPKQLEKGHFAYMESYLRKMDNLIAYHFYTDSYACSDCSQFCTYSEKFYDAWHEYDDKAQAVYGYQRPDKEIKNKWGELYKMADCGCYH